MDRIVIAEPLKDDTAGRALKRVCRQLETFDALPLLRVRLSVCLQLSFAKSIRNWTSLSLHDA
jgi:hypothetical protein